MQRSLVLLTMTLLVLGTRPAAAEEEDLQAEAADLRRRAETLEAQQARLLRKDVARYLDDVPPSVEAQGGSGLQGLTLDAGITGVLLATVGSDPSDTHALHGVAELNFNFDVNENLSLFLDLTANSNAAAFPTQFGPIAGTAGATLSGLVDGIGVDGTISTAPGDIAAQEWGFLWTVFIEDQPVEIMAGQLDPREYYATNAFAADPRTQFLNNLFDDPPALDWPTNATGTSIYGLRLYSQFGKKKEYSFDIGWYNTPGRWFDNGILLMEFVWQGQLKGREFHLRAYGQVNSAPDTIAGGFGLSFDWYATEKIGLFARATVKDNQPISQNHPNQIESDWQVGAVFFGPIKSRPDDQLGVAWGLIKGPIDAIVPGAPDNHEQVIEVYYNIMLEGGKLQIIPEAQYVIDPGGGTFANGDNLFLLGFRLYVPF
jgi:hypothetical protein